MTASNKARFTEGQWVAFNNGRWSDCGAWSVDNDEASTYSNVAVNVGDVTICLVVSDSWDDREMEANAHLIAAAPEMYEMLEKLIGAEGVINNPDNRRAIKAQLAKARGE